MSTRCPPPPQNLPALRDGDVVEWDTQVARLYDSSGDYPKSWSSFRRFGPLASARFDHHPRPPTEHEQHSVAYVALRWVTGSGDVVDPLETAALEHFTHGVLDRHTNDPRLALWIPTRPLRLLQLSDSTWVSRAGGNAALTSGPREISRVWSQRIYATYPTIDGLVWSSSTLPAGRVAVLYDRAESALPSSPLVNRALCEKELQTPLARISHDYDLTLL